MPQHTTFHKILLLWYFPLHERSIWKDLCQTVFGANLQTASRHKPHKAWSAPRVFCKYPSPLCTMQHTLHNFVLLYNNCKRFPRTRDGVDNGGHGAPLGHQQQQGNDRQQGLQKVGAQKFTTLQLFLPGCLLPWSPAFFTWWLLPMLILRWVARQFFTELWNSGN